MGTAGPAGWGAEASASGGARPALAPTQPQGEDAFILSTRPSVPREQSPHPFSTAAQNQAPPSVKELSPRKFGPYVIGGGGAHDGLAFSEGFGSQQGWPWSYHSSRLLGSGG